MHIYTHNVLGIQKTFHTCKQYQTLKVSLCVLSLKGLPAESLFSPKKILQHPHKVTFEKSKLEWPFENGTVFVLYFTVLFFFFCMCNILRFSTKVFFFLLRHFSIIVFALVWMLMVILGLIVLINLLRHCHVCLTLHIKSAQ